MSSYNTYLKKDGKWESFIADDRGNHYVYLAIDENEQILFEYSISKLKAEKFKKISTKDLGNLLSHNQFKELINYLNVIDTDTDISDNLCLTSTLMALHSKKNNINKALKFIDENVDGEDIDE